MTGSDPLAVLKLEVQDQGSSCGGRACKWPASHCVLARAPRVHGEREQVLGVSSCRDASGIGGSTLITSPNPEPLPEAPSPNALPRRAALRRRSLVGGSQKSRRLEGRGTDGTDQGVHLGNPEFVLP